MIRQLPLWYENVKKRQVKSPKLFFRDIGLFHALLGINTKVSITKGRSEVEPSWIGGNVGNEDQIWGDGRNFAFNRALA